MKNQKKTAVLPCRPAVKVIRLFCGARTADEVVAALLKAHAA